MTDWIDHVDHDDDGIFVANFRWSDFEPHLLDMWPMYRAFELLQLPEEDKHILYMELVDCFDRLLDFHHDFLQGQLVSPPSAAKLVKFIDWIETHRLPVRDFEVTQEYNDFVPTD